jgi:hypothetical protein
VNATSCAEVRSAIAYDVLQVRRLNEREALFHLARPPAAFHKPANSCRRLPMPYSSRKRSDDMPDIDLDYLARQNAEILDELRALRAEMAELRLAAGQTAEMTRRNDPRRPNGLTR